MSGNALTVNNLRKHLKQERSSYINRQKLKFSFVSWNIKGDTTLHSKLNNDDLNQLLQPEADIDIYFIALQETIPLNAKNFKSSQAIVDAWSDRILSHLNKGTDEGKDQAMTAEPKYDIVKTNKLLGLSSIFILKHGLLLDISGNQDLEEIIEVDSIGTGLLNIYGNKGGILTKFQINEEFDFYLIDVHLRHGESDQDLFRRRRELFSLQSYFQLKGKTHGELIVEDENILFDIDDDDDDDDEAYGSDDVRLTDSSEDVNVYDDGHDEEKDNHKEIREDQDQIGNEKDQKDPEARIESSQTQVSDLDKSIAFIGGDFNYRIQSSPGLIRQSLENQDIGSLLEFDSLNIEKDQGRILREFNEGKIDFPPTYRYNLYADSDKVPDDIDYDYDFKRKPSYTDRIFHSKSEHVRISKYFVPNLAKNYSDHKPIISNYELLDVGIIDHEKRSSIVKQFLKSHDDKINKGYNDVNLQISSIENTLNDLQILSRSTIDIKLTNKSLDNAELKWKVVDVHKEINSNNLIDENEVSIKIDPRRGVITSKPEHLRVSATLPIGVKSITTTLVLRCINANKDFFITNTFNAKKSYFGSTLDELVISNTDTNKPNVGIPKPIYTLINYLTNNIDSQIFQDINSKLTESEVSIIKLIDNDGELVDQDVKSVGKVLILLLKNLDGGIVSSDIAISLLEISNNFIEEILEKLPPLRANVLIYLTNFLRLCVGQSLDNTDLLSVFEPLLIDVPQQRKRDLLFSKAPNYSKLRRGLLQKLIE